MTDWSHVIDVFIYGFFSLIGMLLFFIMVDSIVHALLKGKKFDRIHPYIGAGIMIAIFIAVLALQSEQILNRPSKINGKENFYCDFCDEWHSTEYFDAYTFMVCEDSFEIWLEEDDIESLNDKLASESDCGICDACYDLIEKNEKYHVVVVCDDCYKKYAALETSMNKLYGFE